MLSALYTTTVLAEDTDAGSRFITISRVETSQGLVIDVGSFVDVLGVIDVAHEVARSGKLLTFLFRNGVYTADFSSFAPAQLDRHFAVEAVRPRNAGGGAELCAGLRSRTSGSVLDLSDVDLRSFLKVERDGRRVTDYSFVVKSSEFCLGGLAFAADYTVTIRTGLTVPGEPFATERDIVFYGRTLSRDAQISLHTASYILPVGERTLLPVTTINVSEIEIDLFRIDPRTLVQVPDLFANLDGYDTRRLEGFYGELLGRRSIAVQGTPEESHVFNLDVGAMIEGRDPGLFVAVFSSPELPVGIGRNRPTQWFAHSNIGIAVYSGVEETRVSLSDFKTLEPVAGADVQVLGGNNRVLFASTSDDAGTVRIPRSYLAGSGGNAPDLLIATTERGDFSMVNVSDLRSKPRFLRAGVDKPFGQDVYLTVPRELFRAGETVDFSLFARERDLDPLVGYHLDVTLTDPQGEEVSAQNVVTDEHGVAAGAVKLKPTHLLGDSMIRVVRKDGVVLADRSVKIDDFVPLTIEAKLRVEDAHWPAAGQHGLAISAEYLAGGPARGLRGDFRTEIRAVRNMGDPALDGFAFGPVQDAGFRFMTDVEEFVLDDAGTATGSIDLDAMASLPPGMYQARILASVRDVGGRPNRATATVPLSTHTSYVGVRSEFGERLGDGAVAAFGVVRVDRLGTALPAADLPYRIVRVRYSYDWYYNDGWRWRRTRRGDETVAGGTVVRGRIVSSAPLDWGSYELIVEDVSGFRTVLPFSVGWGSTEALPASEPERLDTFVEMVGDDAGVLRVSLPFAGVLRVQVAHADVISEEVIRAVKGDVEVPFAIPATLEPGFHVLATLLRPIEAGTEHLPQVALGSTWIRSLGAARDVGLRVRAPDAVRSTDTIAVSVRTSANTGSVVLYLVDEGIHGLTGFRNDDPVDFFYGERELPIGFVSNYGRLIRQDRALPTYRAGGGEGPEGERVALKSEFFKTVAVASPILPIRDGRVSHEFDQPGFEGRLRLVALAASAHGIGIQERTVHVVDPVSIDISLPRFIGTGDRLTARLAVRATEEAASVRLEERVGMTTHTTQVALAAGQTLHSTIDLSAPAASWLPVEITATFDQMRVARDFELRARSPSYPHTELRSISAHPSFLAGKTDIPELRLPAFDVVGQSDLEYRVTVSRTPGVALDQILAALDRYPYGCVEQIVSTTRGLIFREQLDPDRRESARDDLDHGIERIIANQQADGAFGYWSRFGAIREEFQPYAVETLILALPFAEDRGRVTGAIAKGLRYLSTQSTTDIWTRLYSFGVLARAGYEVTSRARYAIDHEVLTGLEETEGTVRERLERISLAYWLADILDDRRRMESLHEMLEEMLTEQATVAFRERRTWSASLALFADGGSDGQYTAPNNAHFLSQISTENRTPITAALVQRTGTYLSAWPYRSTYVNSKLAQMVLGDARSLAGEVVRIDGQDYRIAADGSIDLPAELLRSGFEMRHGLKRPLYLNAEVVGPRQTVGRVDNGFRVTKTWYDSRGERIELDGEPLVARQGDLFTVFLEITPTRTGLSGDTLLTDLLPSGFEIEAQAIALPRNADGATEVEAESGKRPEFVQNMDDRFVAHFTGGWSRNRSSVVSYTVRAVHAGDMAIPDGHIELMYQPEVNGRSTIERARIVGE